MLWDLKVFKINLSAILKPPFSDDLVIVKETGSPRVSDFKYLSEVVSDLDLVFEFPSTQTTSYSQFDFER